MNHALALAAAIAALPSSRCVSPVRVARVHLVDGMPFVTALRPSLRGKVHAGAASAAGHAFAIYDGRRAVATIAFDAKGAVIVRGFVRSVNGGTAVEIESPLDVCPRATAEVTISPG